MTVRLRDHYETLGVPRDAQAADIRRAYRKLARSLHPDFGGDRQQFSELALAYETLTKSRATYDADLGARSNGSTNDSFRSEREPTPPNPTSGQPETMPKPEQKPSPTAASANRPGESRSFGLGAAIAAWLGLVASALTAVGYWGFVANPEMADSVSSNLLVGRGLARALLAWGGHEIIPALMSTAALVAFGDAFVRSRAFTAAYVGIQANLVSAATVAAFCVVPVLVVLGLALLTIVIMIVVLVISLAFVCMCIAVVAGESD